MRQSGIHLYFSDTFEVSPKVLDKYGAFNISLVTDPLLYIELFLLFNRLKNNYHRSQAGIDGVS